jgi:hypothetical protein
MPKERLCRLVTGQLKVKWSFGAGGTDERSCGAERLMLRLGCPPVIGHAE